MRLTKLVLLLLTPAALYAQPALFSGTAVNAVDGQPLSGVHLKLFAVNVGGVPMESYGALSGRDGRFSIGAIPAGTYALLVEKTGFVQMIVVTGAIPLDSITLKAGERITDYKIEMTPRATLAVRVVDESGDPMPGVGLEVTPASPGGRVAASVSRRISPFTDAFGEARIAMGAGKFLVKATRSNPNPTQEVRSDGSSAAAYGPTWYPSATSAAGGAPVELAAGSTRTVEIRMAPQRSMTIGGTVSNAPQGVPVRVYLFSGDSAAQRFNLTRNAMARTDGTFAFGGLPPSYYRVQALAAMEGAPLQSPAVDIGPDAADLTNVHLALSPGTQVAGTLAIAGDAPGTSPGKPTVKLTALATTQMVSAPSSAPVDAEGSFRLSGVFQEKYQLTVDPLPEGGYVKVVALDGQEMPNGELDFRRGAQGTLKITLGRDGAELSGTVMEKDGSPLGTLVAIVILAPDIDHIVPKREGMVQPGGKYQLKGIRPGKYQLFAIDAFRSGLSNSAEDFKKLAVAAEEIEIKAGEKVVKDLKLVLKEDVDARTKK
ncbi:MAG: carboxypeptidase regulatory-like domain-containing protein [Candidatus Solibacter sp.]